MKKIRIISLVVAALFILSSLSIFAEYDPAAYQYVEGAGKVIAKNNTPTIDGNISASEGWSDAKTLNATNMANFWSASSLCVITANVYFAWDTEGLYLAADIADGTHILTTGEDDIDANDDGSNDYGWNGDVLIFGIDPLGACFDAGMTQTGDRTAWYCFSVAEGGVFKCYQSNTQSNDSDITDSLNGRATITSLGWAFECMIPWERIIDDTMNVTLGDVQLTVDEITLAGAISSVGIMYMDRAVASDELAQFNSSSNAVDNGTVFTITRAISVPTVHKDGQAWMYGGESLRSYGIELAIGDASGFAPETTTEEVTEPETTTAKATEKDTEEEEEDTKKETEAEDTTEAVEDTEEGGVNVGLIIGIAAAVVVVAAVVVFIVIKKKKA